MGWMKENTDILLYIFFQKAVQVLITLFLSWSMYFPNTLKLTLKNQQQMLALSCNSFQKL